MMDEKFKREVILHLETKGTNFIIKMLSNFDKWEKINKENVIELISPIKTNELSLYYLLQFFHLFLGVQLEPLYKQLNDLEWKNDECSKIYERFGNISYIFSQTSFSRMKRNRISRKQLLEIRSNLLTEGLVRVRRVSVELPRN